MADENYTSIDYSKVISLESSPAELTYDAKGNVVTADSIEYSVKDVKIDKQDTTAIDFTNVKVKMPNSNYSFDYSTAAATEVDAPNYKSLTTPAVVEASENRLYAETSKDGKDSFYEDRKTLSQEITSEASYSKVNDVKPTVPTDFKEKDSQFERQRLRSVKTYSKIEDNINTVQVLESQEPDFMTNMYNIYLVELPEKYKDDITAARSATAISQYTGQADDTGRDYLSTPTDQFYSILGMRTEGIEIAQRTVPVVDIKVAGQVVKKLAGRVDLPNKASFTIDLDQSMFILDAFHRLNGDWWAKEREAYDAVVADNETNGKTVNESCGMTGKQFLLNFGNLPSFYNLEDNEDKKKMKKSVIDIVVRYDAAYRIQTEYTDVAKDRISDEKDGASTGQDNQFKDTRFMDKANREQIYILHDVRFLGRSSAISFSQESADVLKATFPFTYRKVIKVSGSGYFY